MGQYASILEKIEEKIDEQYERYVEYFQNYHPNRLEAVRERSGLDPLRQTIDLESQIQRSGLEPLRQTIDLESQIQRSGLDPEIERTGLEPEIERTDLELYNTNRSLKKRPLSGDELDKIKMTRSVNDFPEPIEYEQANLNFGGKKKCKKKNK